MQGEKDDDITHKGIGDDEKVENYCSLMGNSLCSESRVRIQNPSHFSSDSMVNI